MIQASPLADRLVFRRISARLGGCTRLIVTGGAAICAETEKFLRICFQCPVVQGYGLTESCAGSFISIPDDNVGLQECGPLAKECHLKKV